MFEDWITNRPCVSSREKKRKLGQGRRIKHRKALSRKRFSFLKWKMGLDEQDRKTLKIVENIPTTV